ncbi:fasciclin domain-containing protein [Spongiivirga citrea]|uniref:FAS1 domain-containing protein n=1 Tax=Spongiivirga citrea TaxID=1481457 RepID=A0A6M0CEU5_9FLAO|nr:fasciclin domain-containing protein [Spongiivirga citrea]NER15942.1 hypothetical protein [Spongiivirga citrea]
MKTLINHVFKKSIWVMAFVLVLGACKNDDGPLVVEEAFEEGEFAESPIISFEEIDEMTKTTIDGELNDETTSKTDGKIAANRGISIERRRYDFNATVTRGADEGAELSGELNVKFTLYHASFAIIRGFLDLGDGERAALRGAWISDGFVYLIMRLPDNSLVFGYGQADDDGDIQGRFRFFTRNGRSVGNWTAELTSVTNPSQDLVDIVASDGRFNTLVQAATDAGLVDALKGDGPLTLFAPTDDAFAALETVPGGDTLKQVLLYHVLDGKFRTQKLLQKEMLATLQGEDIKVSLNENNEIIINDVVKLVQANIRAKNGILHVIDAVLIPPSFQDLPSIVEIATGDENFSTLVNALTTANLVETLQGDGPFTVFAPTNAAFEKLAAIPEGDALTEVLLYHVASGKLTAADIVEAGTVVTLNNGAEIAVEMTDDKVILNGNIEVAIANIMASNGIVHVINDVLIPPLPSIVDIATGDENFSTLVSALSAADLVETLQGEGPFTVFAPTNDAFEKLDALPEGDALKDVLLYHVAAGKFDAATLLADGKVTTIQGAEITVEKIGDDVILNGMVKVVIADIMASNGIVHVIDTVLLPPLPSIVDIAVGNPDFSTLVAALGQANLVDALQGEGPFTVFAPTNAAFDQLDAIPEGDALAQVLLYHVIDGKITSGDIPEGETLVTTKQGEEVSVVRNGDMITLNESITVILKDVMASNGVIHVIDGVLIPPSLQPLPSIVDIAVGNPDFSTLVSALGQAGLVEALQDDGPFTVFAPTNTAFDQLDAIPEGDALVQVLLYHVIDGKIASADIPQGETLVTTKQGEQVSVVRNGDMITLNETISVIVKDIMASNGVIHVIDGVLIPPSFTGKTILDLAKETPELSTLVSAVEAAGLDGVLDGEGSFTVFAPTNDAFAQLAALPEGDALVEVLKYHVVGQKLLADDLKQLHTVTTLQGQDVTIFYNNGKIYLNGHVIQVAIADIEATNGVVHVITGVLIPPASH